MRVYTALSEEALQTRKLLKEWVDDGYLSKEQHQRMQQDVPTDLRTTNIFLRVVLLFFTVICVAAAVGLLFTIFLSRPAEKTIGVFFLIFAAACYAGAEVVVTRAHYYRHGVEEALALCSVGLLCGGVQTLLPSGGAVNGLHFMVLVAGAVGSLWIWVRFGLWYAFPTAMIFVLMLPGYWTASASAQHGLATALFVVGLLCVVVLRARNGKESPERGYQLAEAFLWLGIYLVLNLKIESVVVPTYFEGGMVPAEYSKAFYWTTWVLIWCLPPMVLVRAIRQKARFILAVGMLVTILTFVTNKPYLGWQRHTWDPMILGVVLTGVAYFLRRWLAQGPGGVRHGFTAARLTGKEQRAISVGSTVLGVMSRPTVAASPADGGDDGRFGGGSGGGGASGDF